MLHVLLLVLACALLALGSLTAVRVPVAVNWRLALLAGEFGHALAALPVVVGATAWSFRGASPGLVWVILIVCGAAAALLLKPVAQAVRIARGLPAALAAQLGGVAPARPPFSLRALFARPPAPVTPETHTLPNGLPLDFYRPVRGSAGGAPCVVVIHGGGWDSGDRTQLPGLNHWLVAQGYAVVAISYRLAPAHRWPAQREDVQAALVWLKTHAAELGIDAARLVLLGRSAGGQIAAAFGYAAHDSAVRGVVAFYAPHDMRYVWLISRYDDALNSLKLMRQYLGGPPEGRAELYDSASAQRHVRRGATPPTLLVHGVLDTLVWQRHSDRLAARLAEEGVPHANLALPWAVHAFEFNLAGPSGQLATYALAWFLARVLR